MTFVDLPTGSTVFLDANVLVYHFVGNSTLGSACTQLLQRIEINDIHGFVSTHVIADVAHRLMTLEAIELNAWPVTGIAARLRKHHAAIPKLTVYRAAIAAIPQMKVQVISVTHDMVDRAGQVSQQFEILTGDAIIIAVMEHRGIMHIASNDPDFDRVTGITRYQPM